ncbi:hypothetical protein I4J47_11620 [Corynebacterium belfantii]|uniref:hypothetical protein n=1 Tax=Corynebacterium belfantii TaxID=2014537 RepID=UPI0018D31854|nr:hypothetical protein [Corynebacterium belfantii]MBG9331945.1 hypothetical protein [Corynebacterium belfantii]
MSMLMALLAACFLVVVPGLLQRRVVVVEVKQFLNPPTGLVSQQVHGWSTVLSGCGRAGLCSQLRRTVVSH